jgi:ribosome biogenesis GTPase
VGDWVAIRLDSVGQKAVIRAVLPRKSKFSRKVPGSRTEEQLVAANIDLAFVVSGLDGGRNLNLRRIERYLTLSWSSGASPVIILNKADLCTDIPAHINDIEHAMWGVPIHVTSATEGLGIDLLKKHFARGTTAVFFGISGVGKSSIINALLGEMRLEVGEVREQDRHGRHTTSHRELFLLPGGGAVIDTPGIREIQLWADEDALFGAFPDIEQLAGECRFTDCTHTSEPGCAVREAIEGGALDAKRFQSYSKLRKEIHHLETHRTHKARLEKKAKWKKISRWSKEIKKMRQKP